MPEIVGSVEDANQTQQPSNVSTTSEVSVRTCRVCHCNATGLDVLVPRCKVGEMLQGGDLGDAKIVE